MGACSFVSKYGCMRAIGRKLKMRRRQSVPAEALQQSRYSALITHDAIIVVSAFGEVPKMGRREYFRGTGDNRSMGGVWNAAHGASCQSRSCARSADKEGESVLIWAGVQTKLDWVGGGGGREGM
ncbi:hypothetical protein NQZ68_002426 [Dissostichus eleginoides]|nr:hypothetical protein NQZ68_002426 [Dissostichus eleginoides]